MSLDAQVRADGLSVRVRAAPGAKREGITGLFGGALKIAVQAPPEDGRANERILAVLAKALDLPRKQLSLESGERSRDKRVGIRTTEPDEIQRRLRALCEA